MVASDVQKIKRPNGLETQRALLVAAGSVFSRMAYSQARLRDIAEEAGISQGSLYFHFGNKDDVAKAVLAIQQERMSEVLSQAREAPGAALDRMFFLIEGLAELIASDELVQAGIQLSTQPGTGLELEAVSPYGEWVDVTSPILREGTADGSMAPDLDIRAAAELLNEIFVGAQTLAGIEGQWASLPRRIAAARAGIRLLLTTSPRA
jgi:AcrR family transcriptional regulator